MVSKEYFTMIRLVPMTQEIFTHWYENAIRDFAADKVEGGQWPAEQAIQRSRESYERLLPEGLNTKNNHIYSVQEQSTGENVGVIWVAITTIDGQTMAFVYDVLIYEQHRRKGYGTQAM